MAEPHDHPADPTPTATDAADTMFGDSLPELDAPSEPGGQEQGPAQTATRPAPPSGRNIEAMLNVDLRVQVILGHARMPISQLLKLSRGSVIELDRRIGEPVDVVINDRLVARGDLIKLEGDRIGVTLTEIVKDYVSDS